MNRIVLTGLAGLTCLSLGCAGETLRPYGPDERMTYEHRCDAWGPNEARAACIAENHDARIDCYVQCSSIYVPGCQDSCDRLYGPEACPGPDTVCLSGEHVFTLAREPDVELGAACRDFIASLVACGEPVSGDPCATFERTEVREARFAYECLAALPCGSTEECPVDRLSHEIRIRLDVRFCRALEDEGWNCTDTARAWLAEADEWVRDDVRDAMEECDIHVGEERVRCLEAWFAAITPDP